MTGKLAATGKETANTDPTVGIDVWQPDFVLDVSLLLCAKDAYAFWTLKSLKFYTRGAAPHPAGAPAPDPVENLFTL